MAPKHVKAWTYTSGYPASLKLSSINIPSEDEIKNEKKMLVQIKACALNPVDIQIMNMPKWNFPTALGGNTDEKTTVMDYAGTIIEPGTTGFKKGDDIMGLTLMAFLPAGGALSEVAVFNQATTVAVKKPENWSFEKAAAITLVWLTAKASVDAVAPWVEKTQSKKVAILGGSSSTGIYSVILAKRKGWQVVATSSGRNKDFVVNSLGADAHVDYTSQNVREGVAAFQPDAVIDCVGGTECIGLPSSKRYITIVGDKTGRTMMGGPYTYYDIFHPLVAATQWFRWAKGRYGLGEAYDVVILSPKNDWLEEAKSTLSEDDVHIDSVHKFEKADEAFERLNTGRAKGKVVIQIGERSKL